MILYISIAIYITINLMWILQSKNVLCIQGMKKGSISFSFIFFVLWGITAFRTSNIGNDTIPYIDIFKNCINGIVLTDRIEIGWQLICYLIGRVTVDPNMFIIIITTVIYSLIYIYIYKYSDNILFSTALFYGCYFSSFTNILRQDLAMCLILFAYQMIRKKKNIRALSLILLASTFHKTAIVGMLLFFKRVLPLQKKYIITTIGILIILATSGLLTNIFYEIIPFKYSNYLLGKRLYRGYLGITLQMIIDFIIYVILHYCYKKGNTDFRILTVLQIAMLILSFGYIVNIFNRVAMYFEFIVIFSLSNAIKLKDKNIQNTIIIGVTVMYITKFLIIAAYRPEWNILYPYTSILNL